jgi:hypothetical protein
MTAFAVILLKRAIFFEEDRLKVYQTASNEQFTEKLEEIKVVPIVSLQDSKTKGTPLQDLEEIKNRLNLTFFKMTYTMLADFSFKLEEENFDLEPCNYNTFFSD